MVHLPCKDMPQQIRSAMMRKAAPHPYRQKPAPQATPPKSQAGLLRTKFAQRG
jgi:hypothetical protein